MEARFYIQKAENTVACMLCPHNCVIKEGKKGICNVRRNVKGKLMAETYQHYSAMSFDPIEKKPLYHFYPGKEILSLGSVGCNMRCLWCQNADISQTGIEGRIDLTVFSPERIMEIAQQREKNIGVAYTYNEPSIQIETITEVAEAIKGTGMKNVMVSNGYISEEPLQTYLPLIDAFNIDVKNFEEKTHKKTTGASLKPVLDNLVRINNAEKHLELTYLLVPEVNSKMSTFKSFVQWVSDHLGANTVLHLSRYFPRYKATQSATSVQLLEDYADMASEQLNHVYAGNYNSRLHQHTLCPKCKTILIYRLGYQIDCTKGLQHGRCAICGENVLVMD